MFHKNVSELQIYNVIQVNQIYIFVILLKKTSKKNKKVGETRLLFTEAIMIAPLLSLILWVLNNIFNNSSHQFT